MLLTWPGMARIAFGHLSVCLYKCLSTKHKQLMSQAKGRTLFFNTILGNNSLTLYWLSYNESSSQKVGKKKKEDCLVSLCGM